MTEGAAWLGGAGWKRAERGCIILVPSASEELKGRGPAISPEGLGRTAFAASGGARGPYICKQFAGVLQRCFPPAAWQPDAAQKLAGSLEASLSPGPALPSLILPGQAPANVPEKGGRAAWGPGRTPRRGHVGERGRAEGTHGWS